MALKASKKLTREKLKAALSSISEHRKKAASALITDKLLKNPTYQNSERIGVYLSTSEEVNTDVVVRDIINSGKECFVPRCTKAVMVMEKLSSIEDYENMPLNKWGIKEPLVEESRESSVIKGGLDLVLVPGLGFTIDGLRLGKGKGYYDKFLTDMKLSRTNGGKPFATIGLAFEEQIMKDLPVADWDYRIDDVLFG